MNCIIQLLPQYMNSWCCGRPVEELKPNKTSTLLQNLILYTHNQTDFCVTDVYYRNTSNRMWCKEAECEYIYYVGYLLLPAEQRRVIILWMFPHPQAKHRNQQLNKPYRTSWIAILLMSTRTILCALRVLVVDNRRCHFFLRWS